MSNSRADGRPRAKKIPAELPASSRLLAAAVLIFAEPPAAARRGPAGLPAARRPALLQAGHRRDPEAVPAAVESPPRSWPTAATGAGSNTR